MTDGKRTSAGRGSRNPRHRRLTLLRERRRSWILELAGLPGLTPLRVTLLVVAALMPATLLAGSPAISPLFLAYAIGITPYLIRKQRQELDALEPFFERPWTVRLVRDRLGRHPVTLLWLGWIVGPVATLGVNYNSETVAALRSGTAPDWTGLWAIGVAILYWVVFFQMQVMFLHNAYLFHRLGKEHVRVNILDVSRLTPFARVAIRNLLIFVGGLALAPFQLLQGDRFVGPVLISMVLTVPFAVVLVVLPVWSVHQRLVAAKERELSRIDRALRGNRAALLESPLGDDAAGLDRTGLLLYRDMVSRTSEWPVDASAVVRFIGYVVIPLLAWVGAALVERWVDFFF